MGCRTRGSVEDADEIIELGALKKEFELFKRKTAVPESGSAVNPASNPR